MNVKFFFFFTKLDLFDENLTFCLIDKRNVENHTQLQTAADCRTQAPKEKELKPYHTEVQQQLS